jgi:predicted acyl esterase
MTQWMYIMYRYDLLRGHFAIAPGHRCRLNVTSSSISKIIRNLGNVPANKTK